MNHCENLAWLDELLPNGFHDAILENISISTPTASAEMILRLSFGDPDAETDEGKNNYRLARLIFRELVYFVIDAPAQGHEFSKGKGLRIDGGDARADAANTPKPRMTLPDGAFAYWFFVDEWNSFIHVAARYATLEWFEALDDIEASMHPTIKTAQ